MKKSAFLLTWLLIFSKNGLRAEIDESDFKRAVVQAYNASKSFSQNFYELLGLLCPDSVYCQTNGTFDKGLADFPGLAQEDILGTDGFLQNYDLTAISEARTFLQRNAHHLSGCCGKCSCNTDCRERQNCCPTMNAQTPSLDSMEQNGLSKQECIYANAKYFSDGDTGSLYNFQQTVGMRYYMVSDCALTNMSDVSDSATKCRDPDIEQSGETTPVYSTALKRLYKNTFCAKCNDVSHVTEMTPSVAIHNQLSLTEKFRLPETPQELYRMIMDMPRFFDMSYPFPTNDLDINDFLCVHWPTPLRFGSAPCDANTDLDDEQRYLFKRACDIQQQLYYTGKVPFRNVFCFLCFHIFENRRSTCGMHQQSNRYFEDSFTALLIPRQPGALAQPEAAKKTDTPCSCAEVFDTSKKLCREILCPPGEISDVCACVPFLTGITGMKLRLHLEILPKLPDNVPSEVQHKLGGEMRQSDVLAAITQAVRRIVASRFGPLSSESTFLFRERATAEKSTWTFHYCELLTLKHVSDDRKELKKMFKTLHSGLTKTIVGTQMRIGLGQIFQPVARNTEDMIITDPKDGTRVLLENLYPGSADTRVLDWTKILSRQSLRKLVYCKRVKLDEEEVGLLHNVTVAVGWSSAYLEGVYREEDGEMCLDDFEAAFMPDNSGACAMTCLIRVKRRELYLGISVWVILMNLVNG